MGVKCEILTDSKGNQGLNRFEFKTKELTSGIYLVKLISGSDTKILPVILIKLYLKIGAI